MATGNAEGIKGRKVVVKDGPILMSPRGTLTHSINQSDQLLSINPSIINEESTAGDVDRILTRTLLSDDNGSTSATAESFPLHETLNSKPIKHSLFGGAITMSLPDNFEDVSSLRQVPDHQEVFVDKLTETSLIVEILNYEETITDENAASYYFEDLAQCNQVI